MTKVLNPHEERVLVLTPTAQDAKITSSILTGANLSCATFSDLTSLCEEAEANGAGAFLITEEVTASPQLKCLTDLLHRQPPWSEIPLLVLTYGGMASPGAEMALNLLGNATLVERPVRVATLVSVVRTALSARRRQYEIRDYVRERERHEAELRESQDHLRLALNAGRLGSWRLDAATGVLECSPLCKAHFGRAADEPLTYSDFFLAVHPEERDRVRGAIRESLEEHKDYDIEYRVVWPDGSGHWLMARGRATYGVEGNPLQMAGVTLDITERREAEQALREADQRKDEFLAMLAHELRNPLAPMTNALYIMAAHENREQGVRARQVIERQVQHMSRLIDDLLDVSRISTGKIDLRKTELDLTSVLQRAMESTRSFIEARRHRLTVNLAPEPLPVLGDPARMEQVFTNLLTNAAKYTDPGGEVVVTAVRERGWVTVRVQDSGIGISPELLPEVFDLFRQADHSLARTEGGLGIGLTLVRKMVELHGGQVSAASEGIGKGSEFIIRLPMMEGLPLSREDVSPHESFTGKSAPGRRILAVDDNEDMRESLAELLQICGHEVRTASDGEIALQTAREFLPDVIILDIGLPGKDGYQVAQELRRSDEFRETVLIAVSGYGMQEDRALSREAGFDHHLVKPVDLDHLLTLIGARYGAADAQRSPGSPEKQG